MSRKMRKSSLLLTKMQKCAIRSPSKYHDTLQFDEARFSSPSNLFPKEGIGFTHEDEQGSQELKLEIERQKTWWLLLGYEDLFNDFFCAGFYTINHFPETQIAQS